MNALEVLSIILLISLHVKVNRLFTNKGTETNQKLMNIFLIICVIIIGVPLIWNLIKIGFGI